MSRKPSPHGRTVTFVWNRNAEASVVGYRLHLGRASRTYDLAVDCGDVKTARYTLYGKGMWYCALTAYTPRPDSDSDYSQEVSTRV